METQSVKPKESNAGRKSKKEMFSIEKIEAISKRMQEPQVEQQRLKDIRTVVRSIKDPNLIIKGTKEYKIIEEVDEEEEKEEKSVVSKERGTTSKKSLVEKGVTSLHSLYKLPGTSIKLTPTQALSVGFLECMSGPRLPKFDETESDTTCERMSNDEDTVNSDSIKELLLSETEEETTDNITATEDRASRNKKVSVIENPTGVEGKAKKPKLKRWRAKLKQKPIQPDPLITELTEGIQNYLNYLGIYNFMNEWLINLYGMNPKPKDPVKKLKTFLDNALGSAGQETGIIELESDLRTIMKREDIMMGEIGKLKHLTHLLAPEIYDPDGNMIIQEPSVEDVEEDLTEEEVMSEDTEKAMIEVSSTIRKAKRGSKTKAISRKTKAAKKLAVEDVVPGTEAKTNPKAAKKEKKKRKKTATKAKKKK